MLIRTRIASAGISLEANVPTKDHPVATQEVLSFGLLPTDDGDHLDLETGEVFEDYDYARIRKNEKKLIDASITIRPMPDNSYYQYNDMHYTGEVRTDEDYHASHIYFTVFIEPAAFRELADNVKRGLFPDTVTIGFENRTQYYTRVNQDGTRQEPPKQALEFGWEPDGSGMIWHNKERENLRVPIQSVRFEYGILKPRYDEKQLTRLLPAQDHPSASRVNDQLDLIQTGLAEMLKYLRWIATGVGVLVIYLVLIFFTK